MGRGVEQWHARVGRLRDELARTPEDTPGGGSVDVVAHLDDPLDAGPTLTPTIFMPSLWMRSAPARLMASNDSCRQRGRSSQPSLARGVPRSKRAPVAAPSPMMVEPPAPAPYLQPAPAPAYAQPPPQAYAQPMAPQYAPQAHPQYAPPQGQPMQNPVPTAPVQGPPQGGFLGQQIPPQGGGGWNGNR